MFVCKETGSSNKAVTVVAQPNLWILIIFFQHGLVYHPHVLHVPTSNNYVEQKIVAQVTFSTVRKMPSFRTLTIAHFMFLNSFYFFHLLGAVSFQWNMSYPPHWNPNHLFNKNHISVAISTAFYQYSGSSSPRCDQMTFFSTNNFLRNLTKYILSFNWGVQVFVNSICPR